MGTNYYAVIKKVNGFETERLHIGKKSAGWRFSFRGYPKGWVSDRPELELDSAKAWRAFLESEDVIIVNEYETVISLDQLWEWVESRHNLKESEQAQKPTTDWGPGPYSCRVDEEGYKVNAYEFS